MKNSKDLKKHIEKALLVRKVEEKLLNLYSQGKLNGTIHTCVGQELSGVCIAESLTPDDFVVSNHRGHGHYLARTGDVKGLIAEVMGKKSGTAGGVGGSQHLCNTNYISNGIQGGMTPIASGIALGFKLKKQDNIAVAYIGDGTLGEGILYESLNLASIWNCPVLFVLEHNQYAQSTSWKQSFGGQIADRVNGFGITYFKADTWDLDNLLAVTSQAVAYVRQQGRPAFIEISTYRLNSHSKGDDNRDEAEVAAFRKKDLINQFAETYPEEYREMEERIFAVVARACEDAEKEDDLLDYPNEVFLQNKPTSFIDIPAGAGKRVNELIYEGLKEELETNELSTLIGEDIEFTNDHTPKGYGGAFKVTKDLSILFPGRVRNTPISEAAIVGISTGLAVSGFRAIAEIMFGDFCTLILDQLLQHACKFERMFNGLVKVPLVVRTPMGGKRGYGPTHSQSIEKFFLGIPDLHVFALNHRIDPHFFYRNIFTSVHTPSLVIENKVLYTRVINEKNLNGFIIQQTDESFPTIRITPINKKPVVTVFCYGGMLEEAEKAMMQAFDEEEILCEIIAPSRICPINIYPLTESVKKTGRLIIVEEGTNFSALGSEMIAALAEEGVQLKKIRRLSNNTIIPCSFKAENRLIPGADSILQTIIDIFHE
ncbi:MAG: hypothetical protein JNK14_11010 [Chitinophagaceae bacterium]|nr:hypothetical protein [Chitinophagaceae bacterium]